ncbi:MULTISPECIES: AAA family ATPase [Thermus]|uniref:AAA family ATPase n=1 Tax=Thermus TaxID=270 RepID=UPI001F1BEAFD|nr:MULTISPECIES: SMC family ATPase [Thermus]
MRPLRLELEGFGPYRERQEVDFSDVELFAITGPTGSGKSTLLDAIAFALYGRVPRVGREVANLVHPALGEARVRLTFQVGERVYRVERVRGKRGEGRLFELGAWGERLVPLETLDRLNQGIADLLGLSYEAFTRALLLPQGEFDRFMKGEAKERRQILFDLFELTRLRKARERASERRSALLEEKGRLEGELAGLEGATPEALEALEAELERAQEEAAALEGEKARLEGEVKKWEKLVQDLEERQALEARRARLQAEAPAMEALRERLARAEEAARALPLWQAYREKEAALRGTEAKLGEWERELARLEEERKLLAFDPEALRKAREALLEAQGLRAQEALWRRVGVREHPKPRLDPKALEALLEKEPLLEEEVRALEAWARAEQALRDAEAALDRLKEELKAVEAQGKAKREEVSALEEALKGAEAHALREELVALQGELGRLLQEKARLEGELAKLKEAERRQGLLAYHDLLEPGKPCPLCGGVVHALPPRPEGLDLSGRRNALEKALNEVLRTLGSLERDVSEKEKALKALGVEPKPGDLEALRQAHLEAQRDLEDLRGRYQELRGELKSKETAVRELRQEESRLRQGREGEAEALLAEAQSALAALREEKAALGAGLHRHLQEATRGLGVEAHLRALADEVKALEEKEKKDRALSQKVEETLRTLSALRAKKEEQRKALAEAEASLQGLLPEEEAKRFHLSPEEEAALRSRLQGHEKELAEVEARWRALPPLPEIPLEEARARLGKAQEALNRTHEGLRELGERMAVLRDRAKTLRENLQKRRELEGRLAQVVREVDLWDKLARDLQDNQFPAYLLGLRQQSLVERADALLVTLSGGRYRLLAKEDEYEVYDLWTEARRPVKTLSGGESFLASLSLALALSEELSRGRLGALFLDEGFGTLDPETLEVVAGVLESLPTRGRLVGVVTHVEALAERLPARLRVRKHPSGSRVEWV